MAVLSLIESMMIVILGPGTIRCCAFLQLVRGSCHSCPENYGLKEATTTILICFAFPLMSPYLKEGDKRLIVVELRDIDSCETQMNACSASPNGTYSLGYETVT